MGRGQLSNARLINREIDAWIGKVEDSVKDFDRRDRKRILYKGAQPLVRAARKLAPKSARAHYRRNKGDKEPIKYNPGNVRRAIKRLDLRRSKDAYVGVQNRRKKVREYGGPGQPVDPYYAAMIYGSAAAFKRRVLTPAVVSTRQQIVGEVKKASLTAIKKNARRQGISTGA
ncbi:hypothetical protein [Lewinella sp. JB7]|uniref:hypothetical protein n=1 Tax=Lewinella sp. JB7 TaxID=2962887 RepID=UPI0020C9E89E|nr:hypothetical protein [Lewinella sp. JB7]MCP9237155.1 hypothetical protein [Lewinella sp. JB7]